MKMIRHYIAPLDGHYGPRLDQKLMEAVRETITNGHGRIEQYHVSAELWESGTIFFANTFSLNDSHDMHELAGDHQEALREAETREPPVIETGLALWERGMGYVVITVYGK